LASELERELLVAAGYAGSTGDQELCRTLTARAAHVRRMLEAPQTAAIDVVAHMARLALTGPIPSPEPSTGEGVDRG
jgi:hypothetical protein